MIQVVNIPDNVLNLIKKEGTTKVLVTSSKAGKPHAIVAGTIGSTKPDELIIGEVLFKVSGKNLKENPSASFLFANGLEAYEVEVQFKERVDKGAVLDGVNEALKAIKLHAAAIWTFEAKAVYDQGASPNAGKKIA
ncbi:MAG: pyridoxamine 5'-phosphate oxidase family protein [Candidatus Methanoplasma sp.]|nr:pyridoxamine 5'-phosphate oxidase family protein [Candidatus Methanoplasma sp.]